ncbi:MAG: hypothetical protein IT444_07920 [Phycisphaeraceae bacterium]|nr:hypothetical protein [Phycisphaeraceae bacterium]
MPISRKIRLSRLGDSPMIALEWLLIQEATMPAEMIRLICPNLKCRSILTAPPSARGKTVRCGKCAMKVRIPGAAASDTPRPAAAPAPAPSTEPTT